MFTPILLVANNPGPTTGRGNNTYLLIGRGRQAALIDAGIGESQHLAEIDRRLAERRARLTLVLVTHAHSDHVSGVVVLEKAHEGVRFRKYPWPEEDERYPVPWRPLDDGDRVMAGGQTLEALRTPGHSPDHLSLWHEPSGTVFSGDLVVPGGSVVIQWSRGGDLRDYLDSLRRLLSLQPRRLLPAHGADVPDPAPLLRSYLAHRAKREEQVAAALAAGRQTVPEIAESIYHGLAPRLMWAACENVRAHLEKLKEEGLATEAEGRWTP